jgi:hypothetical protein
MQCHRAKLSEAICSLGYSARTTAKLQSSKLQPFADQRRRAALAGTTSIEVRIVSGFILPTATEIRDIAIRHGKIKKRVNAIAALFCGMFPALWLAFHSHPTWQAWLLGVTIGLIWGMLSNTPTTASCCIVHARSTGPHIKSITRKSVPPRKQNS